MLTNRLIMMAEQVTADHMSELIDKERIELERLQYYRAYRGDKVPTFRTIAGQTQIRKTKFGVAALGKHRSALSRNRNDQNTQNAQEDGQQNQDDVPKIKELVTVCDILLSKKKKSDGSKFNESNESSKDSSAQKNNINKFRRAARTTVLMASLKNGHAICTCETLDARCKVHDS